METKAKEIMSSEILSVNETTSVEEALKILVNNRITGLPVLNKQGVLIGELSEYELIVQLSAGSKFTSQLFTHPIAFSKAASAIEEDAPVQEVLNVMIQTKNRRVIVLNKSKHPVGIITARDVMRLFYYRARLQQDLLTPGETPSSEGAPGSEPLQSQ